MMTMQFNWVSTLKYNALTQQLQAIFTKSAQGNTINTTNRHQKIYARKKHNKAFQNGIMMNVAEYSYNRLTDLNKRYKLKGLLSIILTSGLLQSLWQLRRSERKDIYCVKMKYGKSMGSPSGAHANHRSSLNMSHNSARLYYCLTFHCTVYRM